MRTPIGMHLLADLASWTAHSDQRQAWERSDMMCGLHITTLDAQVSSRCRLNAIQPHLSPNGVRRPPRHCLQVYTFDEACTHSVAYLSSRDFT